MNRRRSSSLKKNIKDYMAPIIGGLLVLILVVSVFTWSGEETNNETVNHENVSWLDVKLKGDNSEAVVEYPGWNKKEIEGSISLYKWEKVIVKAWSASIDLIDSSFNINKLWEFEYLPNGKYALYSWDLWIDTSSSIDLEMKFWYISVWANSNISFSQNEVWSTIYLISWFAEVSNLVWESTVLAPWEKITISRSDASSWDLEMSLSKDNLDEYFLRSDWFLWNGWAALLASSQEDEDDLDEESDDSSKTNTIISKTKLIYFNNLLDESYISSSSITVSWVYENEEITKIVLNWEEAEVNKEFKTFKFENVDVSKVENDLVFKVYDDANDVLSRFVYTVYYNEWVSSNWSSSSSTFKVNNFDIDWSKFTFTLPSSKATFTTYDTFVTIRWNVLVDWIDKVTVNDYELNSFNGSTWRYHADFNYGNLLDWTNIYTIKYFSEGKVVYTNYYTIVKKNSSSPLVEKETSVISNEA